MAAKFAVDMVVKRQLNVMTYFTGKCEERMCWFCVDCYHGGRRNRLFR